MKLLNLFQSPLLLLPLLVGSSILLSAEGAQSSSPRSLVAEDGKRVIDIPLANKRYTEGQRQLLLGNIKNMIARKDVNYGSATRSSSGRSKTNKRSFLRKLAEGDWEFLNTFFETLDLSTTVDNVSQFGSIEFTSKELSCTDFRISDIITNASGDDTEQDLSFSVTGISVTCDLDYSYEANWPIGDGSGTVTIEISPDTNIETILSFTSDDFNTDPPNSSTMSCNSNIEIADITFTSTWLDLLVAPFLPNVLESELEPALCEQIGTVESMLSDGILMISDVLDDLADPIPPELTDKLAPEMDLFDNYNKPIDIDFVPMDGISDFLGGIIGAAVDMISSWINPEDGGPISIPLNITLDESMGIDLVEIRIYGLADFDFDPLSLVGNYTLSTTYAIDNIGFEVELGVKNEDGGTDAVVLKGGLNDVLFDFALLLVVEEESLIDALDAINITDIMDLNFTEVDFEAIADTVAGVVMDIASSVNITNITDITDISDIMDIISSIDINEIVANVDFSVFDGLSEVFQELVEKIQDIDFESILNNIANSIYGLEISSFSLTSSGFDALEVSGLTEFIGPQSMFNEISNMVSFMYHASLNNVVNYFFQVRTRDAINNLISIEPVPTPSPTSSAPTTVPTQSAPDSCSDSSLRFKFTWKNKKRARDCTWVATKATKFRCSLDGISLLCPETCSTCSTCADSTSRFQVVFGNGKRGFKDCKWVGNKATPYRCKLGGVAEACRQTCNEC